MKTIFVLLLAIALSPAHAEFSGMPEEDTVPIPITIDDGCPCPVQVIEVEVPVYIENGSRAVFDARSQMLYLYDIEIWEGPVRTLNGVPYAVFKYNGGTEFELVELE